MDVNLNSKINMMTIRVLTQATFQVSSITQIRGKGQGSEEAQAQT